MEEKGNKETCIVVLPGQTMFFAKRKYIISRPVVGKNSVCPQYHGNNEHKRQDNTIVENFARCKFLVFHMYTPHVKINCENLVYRCIAKMNASTIITFVKFCTIEMFPVFSTVIIPH